MKRIIQSLRQAAYLVAASSASAMAQAGGIQKGASALTALTTDLQSYIDPVTTVVYIVAAIIGLVGALKVYVNWQNGKENVMASATGWLGACLFLLIANTVLRAMFV